MSTEQKTSAEVMVLLALDALTFSPGDWNEQSVIRHLQSQMELARDRLLQLTEQNAPLRLVFEDWNAGHHGRCPAPMPVVDQAHAEIILTAMSNCVSQGNYFHARLTDKHSNLFYWRVCEDSVTEDDSAGYGLTTVPGWGSLPGFK